ncbi:MAG: hypothetical protein NTV87_08300 [Ignavibacteriae bacterium]|nr:hypothetical protein [Ignavibacteriota bacterium]
MNKIINPVLKGFNPDPCIIRVDDDYFIAVSTKVYFHPESFQHLAGLICYYDEKNFYYLKISYDEDIGKCLNVIQMDKGKYSEPVNSYIRLEPDKEIYLKASFNYSVLNFYWGYDENEWNKIEINFDATILSDEYCDGFTGAFTGMCVHDLTAGGKWADFGFFEYKEII